MASIVDTQWRRLVAGVEALNAGDTATGTPLLQQAAALCGPRTPRGLEFDVRANLGEALRREGRSAEADEQLAIAERLASLTRNREGLALTQVRRAQIAVNRGIEEDARASTGERAAAAAHTLVRLGVHGPAALGFYVAATIAQQDGENGKALSWFERAATAALEEGVGTGSLLAEIASGQASAGDPAAARTVVTLGMSTAGSEDLAPQIALHRVAYQINTNLGLPVAPWPLEWNEHHPGAAGLSAHQLCHLHQQLTFAEQALGHRRAAARHARLALSLYEEDPDLDECLTSFRARAVGIGSGTRRSILLSMLFVPASSRSEDPSRHSTTFDSSRVEFAYGLAVLGMLKTAERRLRAGIPTYGATSAVFAHLVLGEVLEKRARRQFRDAARAALLRESFEVTTMARLARDATRYRLPERALRMAHDGRRSASGRIQQFRVAAKLGDGALFAACVASGYEGSLQLSDRGGHPGTVELGEVPQEAPVGSALVAGRITLALLGGREYLRAFEGPMVRMPDGSLALSPFIRRAVIAYGLAFEDLRAPIVVELA